MCEYYSKNSESANLKIVQSIKSGFLNCSGVGRSRNRHSQNALHFHVSSSKGKMKS